MVRISIKNDLILKHIETLAEGTKISVRGLSLDLNISEGTVYKAIKEAETLGLVITKPKSGTFRVNNNPVTETHSISLSELMTTLGLNCVAGKSGLSGNIKKVIIADSDETRFIDELERCNPATTLCIMGNRPDFHTLALEYKAHLLLTDGSKPNDYHVVRANKLNTCILVTPQSTYTVINMLNSHFADKQLFSDDNTVKSWMKTPGVLYHDDLVADWQNYFSESFACLKSFPVVDDDMHICGGIDTIRAFSAPHSQKLSLLISKDSNPVTVDVNDSVTSVARQMILTSNPFSAVLSDDKFVGMIYSTDLLRYYMYAGIGNSNASSEPPITFIQELSTEDRRVYEINNSSVSNLSIPMFAPGIILNGVIEHISQEMNENLEISNSNFFFSENCLSDEIIYLSTTISAKNKSCITIDAEIYSETKMYVKSMFVLAKN